jgi:hypothetical protein
MTRNCCYRLSIVAALGAFMAVPALAAENMTATVTLNSPCTFAPNGQPLTVQVTTNAPGSGASQECYIFTDSNGNKLTTSTGAPSAAVTGDLEFACTPTFTPVPPPYLFRLPPGNWSLLVWSPPPNWVANNYPLGTGGASSASYPISVPYPAGLCPAPINHTCMQFVTFETLDATNTVKQTGLEPITRVPVNGMTNAEAASECHAFTRYSFGVPLPSTSPYPPPPAPAASLKAWFDPAEVCKSQGTPDQYGRTFLATAETRTVWALDGFTNGPLYNKVAGYTVQCNANGTVGTVTRNDALQGGVKPF